MASALLALAFAVSVVVGSFLTLVVAVRLYLWWIHPRDISAEDYRKAWRRQ
jgi:hypothetical protein